MDREGIGAGELFVQSRFDAIQDALTISWRIHVELCSPTRALARQVEGAGQRLHHPRAGAGGHADEELSVMPLITLGSSST